MRTTGVARGDEVGAAMPLKGAGLRPGVEKARESRSDGGSERCERRESPAETKSERVIGVIQPLSLDDDFCAPSKIANFAPITAIMDWSGIILGATAFLITGLFHPIVIKAEYHWGKGCWWLFAIVGLGLCIASLLFNGVISAILGVTGFSCFWSILELFQQEKRVAKGWFPSNPQKRTKARTNQKI